jgi:hypothetical protein
MSDDFPAWSALLDLHRDLIRAREIEVDLTEGTVLKLSDSTFETFEKARSLIEFLDRRQALKQKIAVVPEPLLATVGTHLGNMQAGDVLLASLLASCSDIQALDQRRLQLLTKAVEIPNDAELNDDFKEAVGVDSILNGVARHGLLVAAALLIASLACAHSGAYASR